MYSISDHCKGCANEASGYYMETMEAYVDDGCHHSFLCNMRDRIIRKWRNFKWHWKNFSFKYLPHKCTCGSWCKPNSWSCSDKNCIPF